MITTITFVSQANLADVERCIEDVQIAGAGVHWTSFTEDTQVLEMEVWFSDEQAFINQFSQTQSYQYSNYS